MILLTKLVLDQYNIKMVISNYGMVIIGYYSVVDRFTWSLIPGRSKFRLPGMAGPKFSYAAGGVNSQRGSSFESLRTV